MGAVSAEFRQRLAADALADVAAYYAEVAGYLNHIAGTRFPSAWRWCSRRCATCPTARTRTSRRPSTARRPTGGSLADATQLQGAEPTFNDLLDLDAAYRIATDFTAPTCCIVKQRNPTGLASNDRCRRPTGKALEGDPVSAFGAVVARQPRGRRGDGREIAGNAYEASSRRASASRRAEILAEKERLALLAVPARPFEGIADYGIARLDFQRIGGGLLVETRDRSELDRSQLKVVTQRRPTLEELTDLLFAWRAVRHVTSNAVVLAKKRRAGRRGRRPGQPRCRRSRSRCTRRPTGRRWRCWPRTPTSPSPTPSSSRPSAA
jgi:phosphoribosylaminoimidazolecarboxamide formyltransferase / IMP cyclohydrolase